MREPRLRYAWLEPDAPEDELMGPDDAIRSQRYWPDDFIAETRFQNVSKVVHVQAALGTADPVEETRWLQAHADRIGVPHGIVAYLDLTREDAAERLAEHASHRCFRGIRDFRYDGYLTDPRWERGVATLAAHGDLVLCDDPALEGMPLMRDIAARNPGLIFCVDHAGFPKERGAAYFERWRTAMRALAHAENTVVKISGLGMVDHRWTVDSLRPWVLACIEDFGSQRSFFGTNWPLDRLYSSYGDLLDAYAQIVSDFSAEEQRALLSGNAERIFRLREQLA